MSKPTIKQPFYEPFLATHFPGWHAQRQRARLSSRAMASYRGGVATRTSNAWADSTSYATGMAVTRQSLGNMRSRGRKVYNDNLVGRTVIDTETDNVIGEGFTLQAKTGIKDFDREAEQRWMDWLNVADIRGLRSAEELQATLWKTHRVDGGVGVIYVDRGGQSRLQIIPADLIQTPDGMFGNPKLIDGIEVDEYARPVAFHILNADEWGKREFTRVLSRDFVWLPNLNGADPLQLAGETAYAQIFDQLDNLDQYVDGVALAAWMATVFGVIFKEDNAAKQFESLSTLTNSAGNQQKAIRLEGAMVKYVGNQSDIVQVDAKQPMQQTPAFIREMLRLIGMPFGMPLELIGKNMSEVNFASARIGLLGFYRTCRVRQGRFRVRFLDRTYQWWISREQKRQALGLDGAFATPFPANYWAHAFHSRGWDYTDPVSEAQGDLLEMTMGTKTPQMVAAERGRDYAEMQEDVAAAAALRRMLELPEVRSTFTRDPKTDPTQPQQDNNGN